jgi:hypothetical protein
MRVASIAISFTEIVVCVLGSKYSFSEAEGEFIFPYEAIPMLIPSQERVAGKDNLIKIVRNGPDGQTTDKNVSEPIIRTYAEAFMRNSQNESAESVKAKGKAIRLLTFKK